MTLIEDNSPKNMSATAKMYSSKYKMTPPLSFCNIGSLAPSTVKDIQHYL
jgi:hypothetical protein